MKVVINWKTAALILAGVIVSLGVLGVLAVPAHGQDDTWLRWVDLDRELNLPMLFSAFLLAANGWLVYLLVRAGRLKRAVLGLAVFFVFMAFDEMLKIHETLEKWTGIDWQILYLPLVLAAGIGWLFLWLKGDWPARLLWTGGAACWVLAQGLEAIQWGGFEGDQRVDGYMVMMVAEELLEMAGSSLFLLTLFRWRWPLGWERITLTRVAHTTR